MTPRRRSSRWSWPTRIFLGGQAASLFGDGLAILVVPLLVLELSSNPLVSALSAATLTIGHLGVGLPAGVLVDRLDPWRVLIAMDILRALLFTALFVICETSTPQVWLVLTIALAVGACQVFFETALVVTVKDIFPKSDLIRVNSIIELAAQGSLVLGPATAGALAAAGGLRVALLVNALTFVVSLTSLVAVRRRAQRTQRASARLPGLRAAAADIKEGVRYLLSVRVLVVMTAMQMIINLGLSVEKLIYYFARENLGLPASAVGLVVASGGAGGVLGALLVTRLARRIGQMRLIVISITVCGLAIAAMSVATSFLTLALANLVYLCALIVASLINRTQRQLLVPAELLGRVTGTVRFCSLPLCRFA